MRRCREETDGKGKKYMQGAAGGMDCRRVILKEEKKEGKQKEKRKKEGTKKSKRKMVKRKN